MGELLELLRTLFWGLGAVITLESYIPGPKYAANKMFTMLDYLSGTPKLVVWIHRNKAQHCGSMDLM